MKITSKDWRSTVASLLEKFSNRLDRTASDTRKNTDALAAHRDETRLKIGSLQYGDAANTQRISKLIADLGLAHGRLDAQYSVTQAVKKENDDRETRQTLRDQNNVQSLVNLKDSTQKGFDQVRSDVESLLKTLQRFNERLGQVESQNTLLVTRTNDLINRPAPNTKLFDGVYNVTADLESRLAAVEDLVNPPVNYMGYKVRPNGNILVVDGKEFFPFPERITALVAEPYGVLVTVKNGDQYILCGGPTLVTMFVNFYKRA